LDLAVLKLKTTRVSKQRYIAFGKSRQTAPGSECCVIGDPFGEDVQSIACGSVRDNQYFDPAGNQWAESMMTDVAAYEGNSGSPILNASGQCIGLFTFGVGRQSGLGGGISEALAEPVVRHIIDAHRSGNRNTKFIDADGNYISGFSGILWRAYTAYEQDQLQHPDPNVAGALASAFFDRKIWPSIQQDDIVTHINDIPIGNLPGFFAPSAALFNKVPGDTVQLRVQRKTSDQEWHTFDLEQTMGTMPAHLDYPLVTADKYRFGQPLGPVLRKCGPCRVTPSS
jgi:S1-C subfamily serine protease